MSATADMRDLARQLFTVAVNAADPGCTVRRHFKSCPPAAPSAGGHYIVLAIGKAAPAMLRETLEHLRGPVTAFGVTHHENNQRVTGATIVTAGHPVPDKYGFDAAQQIIRLLDSADKNDRIIALISGGGSALIPAPIAPVTLADKRAVSQLLLDSGLDIVAMNMVRQQLSALKGGGLSRRAAPAPVTALILSDVIGDDLRAVASGPTVAPRQSLEAMLKAAPNQWHAAIASDRLIGDVTAAAASIITSASTLRTNNPTALIFGGETTVKVNGTGRGGRNQELALRIAMATRELPDGWVFLSGGTDGRDGPTDAAGGIVDKCSTARMRAAGVDPAALLYNNDSYAALAASGDLLITGATGTNVADVQVLLLP